jgi:hypothetical protein
MWSKRRFVKAAIVCALLCLVMPVHAASNRIFYNNQDLFLNGANLAWRSFANDIGPDTSTPDMAHFDSVFSQFEANGGNCMRLWLHTTGGNSPAWSGYTVTGPGTDTIADLQTILDDAWSHKVSVMCCLWSFDMMRISNGTTITDRSRAILSDPNYRQTYINNCLIPMVTALQGHPAIVAWEIFNEPEGMTPVGNWSDIYHVPISDIQAFVNQCAGAIHRTDPTVLVTNGCWDMQAGTDVDGHTNYYRDDRLIAAGGDADGTLDFYCIHYYDWAGTAHSPFLHDASYWGLDKPLVIAEFYPDCASTYCTGTPYETLYQRGYAGSLGWSWTDRTPSLMLTQMNDIWTAHPTDVEINTSGDTTPPDAPTGLTATPGNSTVSLNWNDNTETDLSGYNVYRSTTSGTGYTKLNGSLLGSSNYTDSNANGARTYYYFVTAIDTSNNESNDSNVVSATPTDTIPPAAPTGLTAIAGNQTVSLDWNNNSESDVNGYNVYRSITSGSGYSKLNGALLSSSNYTDNSVTNWTTYYYVVTAVDIVSNESGYLTQVSATPQIITDVNLLGSWASGTSHTKENGTDRVLLFIAHGELASSNMNLSSVTYGGQAMTKVIDRNIGSGTRAYAAAYILNEAGVAAATSGTFVPTWSATPTEYGYASVFLKNVNQASLTGASDSNGTETATPNPIKTNPLSTSNGDMVILAATCGNSGSYTLNGGFTEGIDQSGGSLMGSSTGVTGHKRATGAAETPSATFSTTVNRQMIIGFVVKALVPPTYSDCNEVQTAGHRLDSDLNGNCYVDYEDLEIIAYYWLHTDCVTPGNCQNADFTPIDGTVDFFDFADFGPQWMQCNDPENPYCTPNW